MNKYSIIALWMIVLIQLHSQLALCNPEPCNSFKNYEYCVELPDNIEIYPPISNHIIKFIAPDPATRSENRIVEMKINELNTSTTKSAQQAYSELAEEGKGFRRLEQNATYPIDDCKGLFFHGKCRNVKYQIEQDIYITRYTKTIYNKPVQVTLRCFLGPFQSEAQIGKFFREFKLNEHSQ